MGFGQLPPIDALNKVGVSHLRATPQHRGGDLSVEARFRNLPRMQGKKIEVLSACMDNFFDPWIADQFPEDVERALSLDGRKVNDRRVGFRRNLNKFKLGYEGVLSHELC